MKKALLATVAAAALGFGGAAYATPIFLNNGTDVGSNGTTTTGIAQSLGYTGTTATSIYIPNPLAPAFPNPAFLVGATVIDTNVASVMSSYGFTSGAKTSLAGSALNFVNPFFPAGMDVNELSNPGTGVDANGFTTDPSLWGLGGRWGLSYQYAVTGTVSATGVTYTGGYFDIFYHDSDLDTKSTDGVQVLRLSVTGSEAQPANLNFFGKVSFDFAGGTDSFVKNFWNYVGGGSGNFYDKWVQDPNAITWTLGTNVNPPVAGPADLFESEYAGNKIAYIRQAEINGSLRFDVPEPATLALMGLALAGAGAVSRRRKQA